MRALHLVVASALFGCDFGAPTPAQATPAEPSLPALTLEDVCKAYLTIPIPKNATPIAAAPTELAMRPTAGGKAMEAQVIELRAETGDVENGRRFIQGITVHHKLRLEHDGTTWTVAKRDSKTREEVFYVFLPPDHDPRTLFGEQIVERYGPKGIPCELARKRIPPTVTSDDI